MTTTARPPLQCKRCGCYAVAWRQTKAGKWYLCRSVIDGSGMDASARAYAAAAGRAPHQCHTHIAIHNVDLERHAAEWQAARSG